MATPVAPPARGLLKGTSAAVFRRGATAGEEPLPRNRCLAPLLAIVLVAAAAYANSFAGSFVYDDIGSIAENPTIRRLWPIGPVLSPPCNGETVGGRPVLNFSLALNYALGQLSVVGYHAVNLAIHCAAALLLFGILRRTFQLPDLRDRFGRRATWLALGITLVWLIHPLQTESVTYIIQRAESLAGFFYLLTLYCVIRGADGGQWAVGGMLSRCEASGEHGGSDALPPCRPAATPRDGMPPTAHRFWYAAAILACLLGMGTKEILVTAPLVVLLYDRTFLAGSFGAALRRRFGLYLGLAATWALLGYLMLSTCLIARQSEFGSPDVWSYARSQPGVILHYVSVAVWPNGLCFDSAWPIASRCCEILPGAIVLGMLLLMTACGLLGRRGCGFLGAWFLLILAPTSSVLPLGQLAFVHRLYLPLAAIAVLVVAGGYRVWERLLPPSADASRRAAMLWWSVPLTLLGMALAALGYATEVRNSVYRSSLSFWQDAVEKCPNNSLARSNLGALLAGQGKTSEAIEHYRWALQCKPDNAEAHNNLGLALAEVGQADEAIQHYRQALQIKPCDPAVHHNLGLVLASLNKTEEAIEQYGIALRVKPDYATAHFNLANSLAAADRVSEAIDHYCEALRLQPDYADVHNNWGLALVGLGRSDEAIEHYQQALQLAPEDATVLNNLGLALAGLGRDEEAIVQYRQAARLEPDSATVHSNLAIVLMRSGNTTEAIEQFQHALRLRPKNMRPRFQLGNLLTRAGRDPEAMEQYRQILQRQPDSVEALNDLAWLLAIDEADEGGDPLQAVALAQRACELEQGENPHCLDTLAAAYAAAGRFPEAEATAEKAIELAKSAGHHALAHSIRSRLALYRAGQPYREPPHSPEGNKP